MDDLTASKLETAYELIKTGQRNQACEILIPLVRADPSLVDGWFLLGHAVRETKGKIRCFQQVLRFDPNNQPAQKQLSRLLVQQTVSLSMKTKPLVTEAASKPVAKKRNPVLFWGLVGFAGLFICLSGVGFLWGVNPPRFVSPAPIVSGGATPNLPTVTLVAPTLVPEPSLSPKPTSRPTFTLPLTSTPQPSITSFPNLTPTFAETPDLTQAYYPKDFDGCLTPNGMSRLTAPFKIENLWKEKAMVFINGTSRNGNYPIYCRKVVGQGAATIITLMWGNYEYSVVRGPTTRRGSFFVNQPNKATMRILEKKIQIGEFP